MLQQHLQLHDQWYENLSRDLNVPLIMLDIPFNPDDEVSDAQVAYVKGQFLDAIKRLEEITGKKWSDEKFQEVMENSCRTSRAWLAATAMARYTPSPFNGFDLLNHMAVMVTARGKPEAAEAMETLLKEYQENHETGKSTFRAEEKYRIMFEGIACWPWLRVTSTGLKGRGINMVTTIYADAFGFGKSTGIEIGDDPGLVAGPEEKEPGARLVWRRHRPGRHWSVRQPLYPSSNRQLYGHPCLRRQALRRPPAKNRQDL